MTQKPEYKCVILHNTVIRTTASVLRLYYTEYVCVCVCVCAQKREGRQKQGEKRRGGEYDINTKIDSVGGGCRGRSWHAQKIGSREQMVRRRKET